MTPNISIVIPTYNHLEDNLKPALASIIQYSNLDHIEVIVVANGSGQETGEYVRSLGHPSINVIEHAEALGYTKATNVGMAAATGEFVLLLNDDIVLLDQEKDAWLNMLLDPFKDPKVAMTGPVKFSWKCRGTVRTAMAFWCTMIRKSVIDILGPLDEIFNPGMGEDGDYSIKAEMLGFKLVQVPNDMTYEFDVGIPKETQIFPIFHKGNGTFGFMDCKNPVIERNTRILDERYGDELEFIYNECFNHECDINQLFPILRKYASKSAHITEMGVRDVFSTYAFLVTRPAAHHAYDIYTSPNVDYAINIAKQFNIDMRFFNGSTLEVNIEPTDLLFIDTLHTAAQLDAEFARHASKVRKYILMHDTVTYGTKDEAHYGGPGLQWAITKFLAEHPEWKKIEEVEFCNGLTVLERVNKPKISIIVPTNNHLEDALKPGLERIFAYTDLSDKEVIVVSNGSTDGTKEYLQSLGDKIVTVWSDQPLGYIKAVNLGIRAAKADMVVLIDNDSHLLPQATDEWIRILKAPFDADPQTGMTGPFVGFYPEVNEKVIHSGCAMYRKDVLEQLNLFDEIYNPGFFSDSDICLRIRGIGLKSTPVPDDKDLPISQDGSTFAIQFPIFHPPGGTTTMNRDRMLAQVKRNKIIFDNRHKKMTKQINVSIIIPTYNHCDDLLKPCLESIKQYTDLSDKEIIIVANGCTDNTREYVESLGAPFKLIWEPEALGYTKSTNIGIRAAVGTNFILLNNDTILLPQDKDMWIKMLQEPLKDPKMGAAGPLMLHDDYADRDVLIFFCVMIKKEVFDKIGLLDEIYSPGGGEDIDFSIRMQDAGYGCCEAPVSHRFDNNKQTNTGDLPIYHVAEGTFDHIPEYGKVIIKRNGLINLKRYNKNIRLNMGSGGCHIPGYISVDLYDKRAHVILDVTKPTEFDDNSVSEILASHLFEHISPYKVEAMLGQWLRILKPGGLLVMEMPDILRLCEEIVKASYSERWGLLNCVYGSVNTTSEGDPSDITAPHLFGWYPESMYNMLIACGYTDIQFKPEQYPHPGPNFRVEARKPSLVSLKPKPKIEVSGDLSVTAEISTKGRLETTLPNAIMAIANQTVKPKELIIFDDNDEFKDLRGNSVYAPLFNLLIQHGINWYHLPGERKGQTINHQKAIDIAKTDLIWRVDDDDAPEPNVLENLLKHMAPDVGAIGSLIKIPGDASFPERICSANIDDIYSLPHLQWSSFKGIKEADHLNNSFLFRRSDKYSYDLTLSPVGHREETIFSYRIKRAGFKVLINGDVTTWHMKSPSGGIRAYGNPALWDADEKIFTKHMQDWRVIPKNYKLMVLDCGLGDHFVFKMILPDLKKKYPHIILATCYNGVVEDPDVKIISIADASVLDKDLEKYNIYKFCTERKWDKPLAEAFKAMYL